MRKTLTVVIDAEGRDKGKAFHLEEMPAAQAEQWAIRALLALAKSGVEVPEDIAEAGLAGVAMMGLKALAQLHYQDAAPLLAEMLSCARYIPDPGKPNVTLPYPQWEGQVEEVGTFVRLRAEVWKLHVDFFPIAVLSRSMSTTGRKAGAGRNT